MKVFIAGIDGYIGWPLAQYLVSKGHTVSGCDNMLRRNLVKEVGGISVIPIPSYSKRAELLKKKFGISISFADLTDFDSIKSQLVHYKPDAIVHLAEMPSAPYSMAGPKEATFTQTNNVIGTLNLLYAMKEACPDAALTKLGTMGEYGYYDLDIPEGFFEIEYKGRKSIVPFPKRPGSYYHQSKLHDSHNIMFACDTWNLRSTDIMQGIVYGSRTKEMGRSKLLKTRLDIDACFGTVLNRFCAQAVIEEPLTLYGKGKQKRGFLPLCDSLQCLGIVIENPPDIGEYRVFNQFEEVWCLEDLANKVVSVAKKFNINASIVNIDNPRKEKEDHYYNPEHKKLLELGYKPSHNIDEQIIYIMQDMIDNKERLERNRNVLLPTIKWV